MGQRLTINLSLLLKPAAYQVAGAVLSVSRDCEVVLGSLSISIRRRGFHYKEASTLSTRSFVRLYVEPRESFCACATFDVCITVAAPELAFTHMSPDVPFPLQKLPCHFSFSFSFSFSVILWPPLRTLSEVLNVLVLSHA